MGCKPTYKGKRYNTVDDIINEINAKYDAELAALEKESKVKEEVLTQKEEEDAVQEPSTEEVLSQEQEEAGEAGGERGRMGQAEQGEEATQEGQEEEKAQEAREAEGEQGQEAEEEAKKVTHNNLISQVEEYNALNLKERKSSKGQQLKGKIQETASDLGYAIDHPKTDMNLTVEKDGKPIRRFPKRNLTAPFEGFVPAQERGESVVKLTDAMIGAYNDDPITLKGVDFGLTSSQLKGAIKDLQEGKNTYRAHLFLEKVQQFSDEGFVDLFQGTGFTKTISGVSVDEFLELVAPVADNETTNLSDEAAALINEEGIGTIEDLNKIAEFITQNEYDEIRNYIKDQEKSAGTEEVKPTEKESERAQKSEKADELISLGFDAIASRLGSKKNILPEDRPTIIDALKKIAQGLAIKTELKGQELLDAVVDYVKEKFGEVLSESEVRDMAPDFMPTEQKAKPKEKPKEKKEPSGKKKKRYEQRQLKEFKGKEELEAAVKANGLEYEPVAWRRVNPIADEIVANAIANNSFDKVRDEIYNTTNKDYLENDDLSTLHSLIYHKIIDHFRRENNISKFREWSDDYSSSGRAKGRFISAMQESSSPEAISNRAMKQFLEEKADAMDEVEDGKTVAENIKEIQEKLKLKDAEINRLKQAIDDIDVSQRKASVSADKIKSAKKKRKSAISKIRKIARKAGGQASAGLPLNLLEELVPAVRELIESYAEEGYYRAQQIKTKILNEFDGEKNIQDLIEQNWDNIYDDELVKEAKQQAFIEKIEDRAKKRSKRKKGGRKLSPEQILLNTLLSKVNETVKKEKGGKKRVPVDEVAEGIKNRQFSDEVWTEAMENVKSWLDTREDISPERKAEIIADLEDSISGFMETPFSKYHLREAIRKGEKDLKMEINKVVQEHYTKQNKAIQTLAQKLILELGLSIDDAKAYEDRVVQEVEEIFEETRVKEIKKMLNLGKDGKPKGKRESVKRRIVDQIIKGINLGVLEDAEFQNYFAEKYGFMPLSTAHIKHMRRLNDLIHKHQGSEMSRRYMKELMDFAQSLKPLNAEKFYNSVITMMIRSMLTGLSTITVNIPIGSYMSYFANVIPKAIANPVAYAEALKAFRKAGLSGIGRRTFVDVMQSNYNLLDEEVSKFDDRRDVKGDYIDYLINNYDPKVLYDNIKKASSVKSKSAALGVLFFRSYLKLYQAANFAKAFDVIINHKGEELSYFIDEYQDQAKLSGKNAFIGRYDFMSAKKVSEAVKKKMGYDEETVIDLKDEVEVEIEEMKARGEKIPYGYRQRRLKEKMQEKRDEAKLERARNFVKTSTLMEAPSGMLGQAYESFTKRMAIDEDTNWTEGFFKTALKATLGLFIRISVTSAQRAIENIPVIGIALPGVFYDYQKTKGKNGVENWGWVKQDAKTRNSRLATNAAVTAIAAAGFISMFKWDDDEDKLVLDPDRWIDITGYGTGEYHNIEQLNRLQDDGTIRERKNFMLSVKIGDKWHDIIPARLMPQLLPAIAILGSMRDEAVLDPEQFKKKSTYERFTKGSDDIVLALTEQSFATIPRFISRITYAGKREGITGVLKESVMSASNPLRSTLYPSLLRDINQEAEAFMGMDKKSGEQLERLLFKDVPVLEDMMLESSYDIFGYPKKEGSRVIGTLKDNPAASVILENVIDYENVNMDRFHSDIWEIKMKYQPNLILRGYWAPGKSRYLKEVGVKAYGEKMRELWIKDFRERDSNIRLMQTTELEQWIHRRKSSSWHNKSIDAAKKAIEQAEANQ